MIKSAVSQAEEKQEFQSILWTAWLPANLLQIEATQGMIPKIQWLKEITDADVENVVDLLDKKSMTPDREVITFIPEDRQLMVSKESAIHRNDGNPFEMRGLLYGTRELSSSYLRKTKLNAACVENIIMPSITCND